MTTLCQPPIAKESSVLPSSHMGETNKNTDTAIKGATPLPQEMLYMVTKALKMTRNDFVYTISFHI